MWPYTLKLDEKRSKQVGLTQENGFGLTYLHSLLKLGKGLKKLWPKNNVINMIWVLLLVFYWPIIMIGPNGLLLVHNCYKISFLNVFFTKLQKEVGCLGRVSCLLATHLWVLWKRINNQVEVCLGTMVTILFHEWILKKYKNIGEEQVNW
jgi:hypothetical protein